MLFKKIQNLDPTKDRLDCLLLTIEHIIIHLITMLWDLRDTDDTDMYSDHGILFRCMIKRYFGDNRFETNVEIASIESELSTYEYTELAEISNCGGKYLYKDNSCYIDSLLMIMFNSSCDFWKKGILDQNINNIKYKTVKGICDVIGGSEINTVNKLKSHTAKIQQQIMLDFDDLSKNNSSIYCSKLRNLLQQCLPNMKISGRWAFYNVAATYDLFSELFPSLKTVYPTRFHRWKKDRYVPDPKIEYIEKPMTTVAEFMDNSNVEENADYPEILWNMIDSPIIVLYNGGTPRIKDLNDIKPEKGTTYMMGDLGSHSTYSYKIDKKRILDETILCGKYELIGVITLHGVSPGREEGIHYTCHLKDCDKNWRYYDDYGGILYNVDKLPHIGTWRERNGNMPSMFFYSKTNEEYKIINGTYITTKIQNTPSEYIDVYVIDNTEQLNYIKFIELEMNFTKVEYNVTKKTMSMDKLDKLLINLELLDKQELNRSSIKK